MPVIATLILTNTDTHEVKAKDVTELIDAVADTSEGEWKLCNKRGNFTVIRNSFDALAVDWINRNDAKFFIAAHGVFSTIMEEM
jgi:hypothetical protein